MQTYGYEHILTLHNLEKAGLLKPQTGGRNSYPTIRKTLRLWMDDVNEQVSVTPALPGYGYKACGGDTQSLSRHSCLSENSSLVLLNSKRIRVLCPSEAQ